MYLICFLIGMFMGSFLFCVSGNRELLGRSRCDRCHHVLHPLELIPVISFLFLKGRCRHCGEKISLWYPFSEILCGLLYVLILVRFRYSPHLFESLILSTILLWISFHDLKTCTIPDAAILAGILNHLLFSLIRKETILSDLKNAFVITLGLFLLSNFLKRITHQETIGGGDIKLIFLLSLYGTLYRGIQALLIASSLGLLVILISGKKRIPFAPWIALGYLLRLFLFG